MHNRLREPGSAGEAISSARRSYSEGGPWRRMDLVHLGETATAPSAPPTTHAPRRDGAEVIGTCIVLFQHVIDNELALRPLRLCAWHA